MKKAQGISINTIIIAAIALIVLVVLIAIFTGRMSIFGIQLGEQQQGDLCTGGNLHVVEGSCPEGEEPVYANIKQCQGEEDPLSTGCTKLGYSCCRST